MPSAKPVRVIDISRQLNLATSTIIDFLSVRGYPVDRSHHTPLLKEILDETLEEFGAGKDILVLRKFSDDAVSWEREHQDAADKLRNKYIRGKEKLAKKKERARKVIEGKERARMIKKQVEVVKQRFQQTMQSVAENVDDDWDGRIQITPLELEIIQRALALEADKKTQVVNKLRIISDYKFEAKA